MPGRPEHEELHGTSCLDVRACKHHMFACELVTMCLEACYKCTYAGWPCAGFAGESQACAAAAKERIEVLEQEAEQAAADQQAAASAAAQALADTQAEAAKELQAAQDAAAAQLQQAQEQHEAERKKLLAELEAVKVCRALHGIVGCHCLY